MNSKPGIIILAAGSSSRLGQPKQLLDYKGITLLQNTIVQALVSVHKAIVVVTGASREAIEHELQNRAVTIYHHEDWAQGMGSSIAAGLHYLLQIEPVLTSCIIAVCDQPFITSQVFQDLTEQHKVTRKGIVASAYAGTLGTPMLFSHMHFNALLKLTGQEGAKKLLQLYQDDVASIPFDKGAVDIDTLADYNKLINQ